MCVCSIFPICPFLYHIPSSGMAQGISKRLAADAVVALVELTEFGDPGTPETPETGAAQIVLDVLGRCRCTIRVKQVIWVWVNTYRYIFSGMKIHLPAISMFTRYHGFDPYPFLNMGIFQ